MANSFNTTLATAQPSLLSALEQAQSIALRLLELGPAWQGQGLIEYKVRAEIHYSTSVCDKQIFLIPSGFFWWCVGGSRWHRVLEGGLRPLTVLRQLYGMRTLPRDWEFSLCVSVSMFVSVHPCLCTWMWRPEVNLGCCVSGVTIRSLARI